MRIPKLKEVEFFLPKAIQRVDRRAEIYISVCLRF